MPTRAIYNQTEPQKGSVSLVTGLPLPRKLKITLNGIGKNGVALYEPLWNGRRRVPYCLVGANKKARRFWCTMHPTSFDYSGQSAASSNEIFDLFESHQVSSARRRTCSIFEQSLTASAKDLMWHRTRGAIGAVWWL